MFMKRITAKAVIGQTPSTFFGNTQSILRHFPSISAVNSTAYSRDFEQEEDPFDKSANRYKRAKMAEVSLSSFFQGLLLPGPYLAMFFVLK